MYTVHIFVHNDIKFIKELTMAIHTFSSKEKNKEETAAIKRVKEHCEKYHLSFSGIIVQLLVEWERENVQRPS